MAGIFSKLKRTAGLLSVMSMLISSVAACACSHHSIPKAEAKTSCHSHSESASEQHGALTEYQGEMVSGTGCTCSQASPRLIFKQEQKQFQIRPAISGSTLLDPELVAVTSDPAVDNFGTRSFTQSYLGNSTLGRAPPRPKFV